MKARIQQKIECYEVEWQNVALGETCPSSFVTIETREVKRNYYLGLIINISIINVQGSGLEKNYNLNLPFGQASLKFHLPGQDFINCYFSLVHEQLVHILAHRGSEWGKSLVRHKNLLVPDDRPGVVPDSHR